jgi:hypothetical protein
MLENEKEMLWQETVVTYLQVSLWHVPRKTHKISQDNWSSSRSLKPGPS